MTPAVFYLELLSRLELPNLLITNEVLYRLSYSSMHTVSYYILIVMSTDPKALKSESEGSETQNP